MLHLAKQIVNGEDIDAASLNSSPLGRLSRSCSEAARRLLDVVIALRRKDMLSKSRLLGGIQVALAHEWLVIFGFFDFDACFSAAFVMILSAIVDSISPDRCKKTPPPGLRDALDTLGFLSDRGNHLAKRGLLEVSQAWACFSAYLERRHDSQQGRPDEGADSQRQLDISTDELSNNPLDEESSRNPAVSELDLSMGNGHASISQDYALGGNQALISEDSELGEALRLDTNLLDDFAQLWDGVTDYQSLTSFPDVNGCMPTEALHHYLYPLYNSLDLDLVGGDMDSFAGLRQSMLNL